MTDDNLVTSSLRCASTRPIDRFYGFFSSETPKNKLTVGIMDKPYLLPFDGQGSNCATAVKLISNDDFQKKRKELSKKVNFDVI